MALLPTDLANRALDAIGWDEPLGDLEGGSREEQICLRSYTECLKQLSRAAHWNVLRKSAPMTLLADATGQTPNAGTIVADPQFIYEYSLPTDCLKARFIPWNLYPLTSPSPAGNISIPTVPITTISQPPWRGLNIKRARFVETSDYNYPALPQPSNSYQLGIEQGIITASQANPCQLSILDSQLYNGQLIYIQNCGGMTELNGNTYQVANSDTVHDTFTLEDAQGNPVDSSAFGIYIGSGYLQTVTLKLPAAAAAGQGTQFWEVQGVSPVARTVICTDVFQAYLVYTAYLPYPSLWDSLFREAFVAYLASQIALPIWSRKDRKFGLEIRGPQIALAKEKIMQARVTDGNEGTYTSDIPVDWMRTRRVGRGFGDGSGGEGAGPGAFFGGYDSCGFCDGSSF